MGIWTVPFIQFYSDDLNFAFLTISNQQTATFEGRAWIQRQMVLIGSFEAPGSFCDKLLPGRLESLVSQDELRLALLVQVLGFTTSTLCCSTPNSWEMLASLLLVEIHNSFTLRCSEMLETNVSVIYELPRAPIRERLWKDLILGFWNDSANLIFG